MLIITLFGRHAFQPVTKFRLSRRPSLQSQMVTNGKCTPDF